MMTIFHSDNRKEEQRQGDTTMKCIAQPHVESNLRSTGGERKWPLSGVCSFMLPAFFLASSGLARETSEPALQANASMHIYLLIGQSNMAGRGQSSYTPATPKALPASSELPVRWIHHD